jgi:hypothetical protein
MAATEQEPETTEPLSFILATVSQLPKTLEEMVKDPRYNQGRDFVNAGDFDHAIELFENLLKTT